MDLPFGTAAQPRMFFTLYSISHIGAACNGSGDFFGEDRGKMARSGEDAENRRGRGEEDGGDGAAHRHSGQELTDETLYEVMDSHLCLRC